MSGNRGLEDGVVAIGEERSVAQFGSRALEFLAARGIAPIVASEAGVVEKTYLSFPYPSAGTATYERVRALDRLGPKIIHPRNQPLALWWPLEKPASAFVLVMTEGETDALALLSALAHMPEPTRGRLAVAATQGTDFPAELLVQEALDVRARLVLLAFDADHAGSRFTDRVLAAMTAAGIRAAVLSLPPGSDLSENLVAAQDPTLWFLNALAAAAPTAMVLAHRNEVHMENTAEQQDSSPSQSTAAIPPAEKPPTPASAGGLPFVPGPGGFGWMGGNIGDSFVYAVGRVVPRFPSVGIEKEFAQAVGRGDNAGLTDRQALHATLTAPENAYLARQLCWVFAVEGIDTYLLRPRDAADLQSLVGSVRPSPRQTDVDVIVGVRGPLAPPDLCGGLVVPIVLVDQLFSFDIDTLIAAIPRPEGVDMDQFAATAEELFSRIVQLADNAGTLDGHRAINYLVVRYPALYATTTLAHARDDSLANVEVKMSRLAGTRKIVDVIFTFTSRRTDVATQWFARVDVTEEFPFLVTKLSPYFGR